MAIFSCCSKKRSFYLPEEESLERGEGIPQGPFQLNRKPRKLKKKTSKCSSSLASPRVHSRNDSMRDGNEKKVEMSSSLRDPAEEIVEAVPQPPVNAVAAVVVSSTTPPPIEDNISLPPSTSSSSCSSSSTNIPPIVQKSPPPETTEAPNKEEVVSVAAAASSSSKSDKRSVPAEDATAPVTSKPKAKAKAKAKGGIIRSGNQPVPNAKSASPTGLRTKDHSKMVEMLNPKDKKLFITAANFIRKMIDSDPSDGKVIEREASVMFFLLLFAAKVESTGGINLAATVISHLMTHSAGDPALSTKSAKELAPKVQFLAQHFYRPLIEAIIADKAKSQTGEGWLEDCRSNAKFAMGTKPKFINERVAWVSSFMSGEYLGVHNCTDFKHYQSAHNSDNSLIEKIAESFDLACPPDDFQKPFLLLNGD
eukprot:GHVH01004049.1.p1 GENE.GHVH01004049.1~~GHVH01004049.1.p1  ORF type:complete len:423 (+),score=75.73 GHVH01004049.1:1975-3243(+)